MTDYTRSGPNYLGPSSDSDKKYVWKNNSTTDYIDVVLENVIIVSEINSAKVQLMSIDFDKINETAYDNFSKKTRDLLSKYVNHKETLNVEEVGNGLVKILVSMDEDLVDFKKRSIKRENGIINGRHI